VPEGGTGDGRGSRPVSAVSEGRRDEVGQDPEWQGAISLFAKGAVWPDIPAELCLSRLSAHRETADRGEDTQGEGEPGYRACAAGRAEHGAEGSKKKRPVSRRSTRAVVEGCCPDASTVEVRRVEAAEVDEMWSFVGSKAHPRWLWHAIDHLRGVVLAYAFGSRAAQVFRQLEKLLTPFGVVHFYTDGAGVYERSLPASPIPWARLTPSRSNANLSRYGHGSSDWLAKQFVSPNPSSCMIPCLDSL